MTGDIDGFFTTARVSGRAEALDLPNDSHLNYLLDRADPKVAEAAGMTYTEFARDRARAPFLAELLTYWDSLYREPFVGITSDGNVRSDVWTLPAAADIPSGRSEPYCDATDDSAVAAAQAAMTTLNDAERAEFCYSIDAAQWRAWSNPEFVVHNVGLRLEDLDADKSDAILGIVRASLSPEGYQRVRHAMALNGYLGELVGLPNIMNDRSYFVALFGTPSTTEPWGWQLFGHHVAVNFMSVAGRHVVAPVFLGGEPTAANADEQPLFERRENIALELAASLSPEQRAKAVVYESVLDPKMPVDRLHPADERHLAGAFRDNRVIGYEGIAAGELAPEQRVLLRAIISDFHALLSNEQHRLTMAVVDAHLDETWLAWYGPTDGSGPFYFRIQSPVVLAELDDHAGVWLTNRLPARFHVHTVLRLPNGNDYGRAYLQQWCDRTAASQE